MADAVRNVLIRLNLETGRSEIQAPDTSAITDALAEEAQLRKQAEEAARAAADAQKAYEDELAAAIDAANDALEEQEQKLKDVADATDGMRDAAQQGVGAVRQLGTGMLALSRASALLGLDGTSDMAKFLETLMKVQIGMDLLNGSLDVIDGIMNGMKAMKAAAVASAAAKTAETAGTIAHTGAMAAEATMMGVVTAAAGPMLLALAPIALIAIGIGVALFAAFKAWQWFTQGARDAEEAEKAHAEQLVKLEEQNERVAQSKIRMIGIHADEAKELRGLKTEKEQLAELEASNLEAQLKAVNAEQDNLGGNARARDLDLIAAKREVIMGQIEEQAALEQKGHDIAKKDLELREAELKVTREQIKAAKESLQAERDKTDSLAEQFGMMSALDQRRLKQLEEIKNTTGLTLEQAKEMIAINAELAGPEAKAVIRKAGEEAGIGGFSAVKKARADQGAAAAKIASEEEGAGEEETSIAKAKIDATKNVKDFMDNITGLMETGIRQTAALKEKQEQVELRQAGRQ